MKSCIKLSRRNVLVALFAAAVWAPGFLAEAGGAYAKPVTPVKAKSLIDNGAVDLTLDVRTPAEFNGSTGHLKGAKLIPVQQLADRLDEIAQFKDKTILVYCHSGVRSMRAGKILAASGFKVVLDLSGGIVGWIGKGYETEK